MAKYLYRLGKFSFRKKWWFLTAWLLVLGLTIGAVSTFAGTLSNSFSIPGTQSQETLDMLQRDLPGYTGGSGTVVFATKNNKEFTAEEKEEIGRILGSSQEKGIENIEGVDRATNSFQVQKAQEDGHKSISENTQKLVAAQNQVDQQKQQLAATGVSQIPQELKQAEDRVKTSKEQLDFMKRQLDSAEDLKMVSDNSQVAMSQITLSAPVTETSAKTREDIDQYFHQAMNSSQLSNIDIELSQQLTMEEPDMLEPGEIVGIIVAAIILFAMLGTVVAMGLPLFQAILGVGIGVGATMALSGVIDMSSVSTTLALMLGLAVGIDYSLFIINRYRRELEEGYEPAEAAGRSLGTSGSAVFFAGLTVIIALAALSVPRIPFLSIMGFSGAFTVLISMLVALTLTPATLAIAGKNIMPKRLRAQTNAYKDKKSAPKVVKKLENTKDVPQGYLKLLSKFSPIILVAAIALLAVMSIPAASLHLGLPDGSQENQNSSAYKSTKLIDKNFGPGYNATIIAAITLPQSAKELTQKQLATQAMDSADELKKINNVDTAIALVQATPENMDKAPETNIALVQIIPQGGPADKSTEQVVRDVRETAQTISQETGDKIGITGMTAMNIDMSQKLADAMPQYLLIVIGLSLVLLLLVFRSIILPILATGGFLLSLAASFGATVAVYQWGWLGEIFGVHDTGPVLSFLPIILVGVLFGLAMDYQVFLGSAMREEYVHGSRTKEGAKKAVLKGLSHSRRVVIAAAIIMIAVFAGFIFNEMPMIRPIGFALAFGVLIDAFVVRMAIIPSAMYVLGKNVWSIPAWLDKILPDIDVEGVNLDNNSQVSSHDRAGSTKKE